MIARVHTIDIRSVIIDVVVVVVVNHSNEDCKMTSCIFLVLLWFASI